MRNLPDWLVNGMLKDTYSMIPRVEWTIDRKTWHPLRPISGSTTQDAGSQTRWAFNGTFMPDYPVNETGIHPFGCRARIFFDITVNGRKYALPMGHYSITKATRDNDTIGLTGLSFETEVIDSEFAKPRRIPDRRYMSYRAQTEVLIREAVPDARFNWDPALSLSEGEIPRAFFDNSRWTVIDGDNQAGSMMGALGGVAYCDYSGAFNFVPLPKLNGKAAWRVTEGNGVKVSSAADLDRTGVYNVLTVASDDYTGDGAGPGHAWDDDPNSITYAGPDPINSPGVGAGPYGVKVLKYTNSLINTDFQAIQVAQSMIHNYLGLRQEISFDSKFHPGLLVDDIVAVDNADGRISLHLLESITHTWGETTVSCTTRSMKTGRSNAIA
jgi:hypothetical protein